MSNKSTNINTSDSVVDEVRRTALDLCHRITSLSIRAIEINQADAILAVLVGLSDELEAYEEVCKDK